jgi:hypothetical protein
MKKEKNKETQQLAPEIEITTPEDGTYYTYANQVNLTWTAFDIQVHFAELLKVTPDRRKLIVEERAVVTMAWAEAKQLMLFMQQAVSQYESLNGELKLVPDLKVP